MRMRSSSHKQTSSATKPRDRSVSQPTHPPIDHPLAEGNANVTWIKERKMATLPLKPCPLVNILQVRLTRDIIAYVTGIGNGLEVTCIPLLFLIITIIIYFLSAL